MTQIKDLKVENIKGVKFVHIEANQPIIKISGDNGQGKSSTLDSISYAIGGKRLIPSDPIRKGKDTAEISVTLDDLIITRTFRRKGNSYATSLKVVGTDGSRYTAAQEVLDALLGRLSFDPLAFSRMDSKKQADVLRGLVDLGIDLEKWQAKHDGIFEDRRDANRDRDHLLAQLEGMAVYPDGPAEVVTVSELSGKYNKALETQNKIDSVSLEVGRHEARVSAIKREIEALEKEKIGHENDMAEKRKQVSALRDSLPNVAALKNQLDSAEENNSQARANIAYKEKEAELETAKKVAENLDNDLREHNAIKANAIKAAEYPVEGLEFEGDELVYNGVPLDQARDGEKLLISAEIGMALNPELKVLLLRNASLLGDKNFNAIAAFAGEREYQLWCEYVDTTGEIGFYLEDGEVVNKK